LKFYVIGIGLSFEVKKALHQSKKNVNVGVPPSGDPQRMLEISK